MNRDLRRCEVKGCSGKYLARGYCSTHYTQVHKYGRLTPESEKEMHGLSNTRLYVIWVDMKKRCRRSSVHNFKYYGGKGITVCKAWVSSFYSFYTWAVTNGYGDELTIDRIDSDKGYTPENCQWLTKTENALKAISLREQNKGNKNEI